MRAMVYRGPYRVGVEEKERPRIEHPNDAIIRVTMAAICGSDLHLYHGLIPDTRVGHTFGHEFVGVVDEVGPSVERLRAGDRVDVLEHRLAAPGTRRALAVAAGAGAAVVLVRALVRP